MVAVEAQTSPYEVTNGEMKYVTGHHPVQAKDDSRIEIGSTADIWSHSLRPDVVIKAPHSHEALLDLDLQNKCCTEAAILESLGSHPRIIKYSLPEVSSVFLANARLAKILGLLDPPLPHKGLLSPRLLMET